MTAETKFGVLVSMVLSIFVLWQLSPLDAVLMAGMVLLFIHVLGRGRGSW